jgi:ATP-dependent exoDNAse (exonuclease V) beta subunit
MIEKGNAMHKAFARVWADQNKSVANIQTIIESTVREHVLDTLLKGFEKEALITELIDDSSDVAKCLEDHFAQQGTQFIESWTEFEYKGTRLHGKLDAVIDTGDQVLVFDYKTRSRMSENAIKGLTKADTHGAKGAYFRQMVFYKMLLENDQRFKGKHIIPSLVFVKPDEKGLCHVVTLSVTDEDVAKVKGEVESLMECVN